MAYFCVTSVLAAAASYNLTDLATVKDELSIDSADTSDDTWLTRAIAQVSSGIARYTKRTFPPELVQDLFDVQQDAYPYQTPGGFAQLQLSRWPVLSVVSVVQALARGTTQVLVEGIDFRADPDNGALQRLNPFTGVATTWEACPVTVIYCAGYGALVNEAHAVPASPYQVAVAQASTFSCALSVAYADGAPLTLVAAAPSQGQFSVSDGVFTFAAADAGQALSFAYATAAIPADLVEIALRIITGRYAAKDRDPALIQQETPGIGSRRWWFGGAPGQKGPFPPDIAGALDDYRTPTIG